MTTDPQRRRRREDLVRPLTYAVGAAVAVILVLTYSVLVLGDRQDQINETATTAQHAADAAKAATGRVRVLAVDNKARARAAKELADQLNRAVCAWRNDLQDRAVDQRRSIAKTERFLKEHPEGIPGVPVKLLKDGLRDSRASLKNLRSTITAFEEIDCS